MTFPSQLARLNSALALERLGGDEELLREVAGLFLEEYPQLQAEIHEAVAAGDAGALQRAAHSLKGSVANFGADGAMEAAYRLELIGRGGDLSRVAEALREMDEALAYIHPALVELATAA